MENALASQYQSAQFGRTRNTEFPERREGAETNRKEMSKTPQRTLNYRTGAPATDFN
jgi:hypothetical protein